MNLVFMGTADFAAPTLRALAGAGHRMLAVYTQPDRPSGRGLRTSQSPVKRAARVLGLEVLQPESLKPAAEEERLRSLGPDLVVVVAYGLKLPPAFLKAPRHGCLNLHPSLLPKYRGAAPINWALIRGEAKTGISVIRMNERMDAGDIALQQEAEIYPDDDAGSLEARLAEKGADLMVRCLAETEEGRTAFIGQNEAMATLAPKLTPKDRAIDWNRTCRQVRNQVRGLTPRPGAQTRFRGKLLEVAGAREASGQALGVIDTEPGMVIGSGSGTGFLVRVADGVLALTRVKPEGKRMMSGDEFARGYRPEAGEKLG